MCKKFFIIILLFLSGCGYRTIYQYQDRCDTIAGYKISINEYHSGLIRTKEKAIQKLRDLRKNIKDEDLTYIEFTVVNYED